MEADFLQSEEWRKFQGAVGRPTFLISGNYFHASIIEHRLPIVGKYFYVPRGPVVENRDDFSGDVGKMVALAEKEGAGWIRIEPSDQRKYDLIAESINERGLRLTKAPHDMQPREILLIDIGDSEEDLLSRMKAKTRYNVRLAEKKNVKVSVINKSLPDADKYLEEFLRLIKITAARDRISPHPDNYYRQMFASIPEKFLKLYVVEYENKIIAANMVIFYGEICTYLHGASDNMQRNLMAPYLLQWRQIQDAKKNGCSKYDFGGVSTSGKTGWEGITRFKQGFSEKTKAIRFPGSHDIIISRTRYNIYRLIQKFKNLL